MKKYSAIFALAVCIIGAPLIYQNCSPAEFAYTPAASDSSLVFPENGQAVDTNSLVTPEMYQTMCTQLGGTYDPNAANPSDVCQLNYFNAADMNDINSRFCQEVMGGVWDPSQTPACALPFLTQGDLDAAHQDIQDQIDNITAQLGQFATINAALDDLQTQINDRPTRAEFDALLVQVNGLQAQFDALDLSQFVSHAELQNELANVNGQISDINTLIQQINSQTQTNTQDIANLNARIDALQNNVNSIVNDYNALVSSFNDVVARVTTIEAKIDEIRDQMVTKEDLAGLRTELMAFISDINARLDALYAMNLVSRDELNSTLAPILASITSLTNDLRALEQSAATQDQLNQAVADIDARFTQLNLALEALTSQVGNHSLLISEIRGDMSSLQALIDQIQANGVTQDELQAAVSNLNQQISAIISQVNALNDGQDEQNSRIDSLVAALAELRTQVNANSLSVEGLANALAAIEAKMEGFEDQLAAIIDDLRDVINSSKANAEAIAQLQSAINALNSRVTEIQANGVTKDELQAIIGSLRQDIDVILARLLELQATDDTHSTEITNLMNQISQLSQQIIALEANNEAKFEELIAKFSAMFGEWGSKISDIINSITNLEDRLDNFYTIYSDADQKSLCLALGGVYDESAIAKCHLNIFHHLKIRKRVKMTCMNSSGSKTLAVTCPRNSKLIGCSGRGGAGTSANSTKGTITPDFNNRRCVLRVTGPECDRGDKKTYQRIVAICASGRRGGRTCGTPTCPQNMQWNSSLKRCEHQVCPMNTYRKDGKCLPLVPTCMPGSSYDPSLGRCVHTPIYCMAGWVYNPVNGECLEVESNTPAPAGDN